jgi:8-oxo-dGTP pyrophosphatase MutT (NUDIX family)
MRFDDGLRATLRSHLESFERRALPLDGRRAAAVAVVAVPAAPDAENEAVIILTVRAAGLRRHGGQWALPGGRRDPGETAEAAALRELEEEVGLTLPPEHVLGCLDDYPTRSGFIITPVVVWGSAAPLRPDPAEVARIDLVPFAALLAPDAVVLQSIPQSERPVLALSLSRPEGLLYAPTAAILHQFAEVALCGRATRVAHYEQPLFAWR